MASKKLGTGSLNQRQERFVARYCVHLNGSRAYKEAGYTWKTDTVARVEATKLLANPIVAAAIKAKQASTIQASDLTAERILREVARIAFSDVRRLYDAETGELRAIHDIDDDSAAAVASVETETKTSLSNLDSDAKSLSDNEDSAEVRRIVRKLKVWDKLSALSLAMRHHGMLRDNVSVSGSVETAVKYVADMPKRGSDA